MQSSYVVDALSPYLAVAQLLRNENCLHTLFSYFI